MTGTECLNIAYALMNEVSSTYYTPNLSEYSARALPIINALMLELAPHSDTFATEGGVRDIPTPLSSLSDTVHLDEFLCRAVLPYGLAAQLQMNEDTPRATFNQQKFEELKALAARGMPSDIERIEDVYGIVNQYDTFGRW